MSLLSSLGAYCAHMESGQFKPQQRWVRDVVSGMLMSRSMTLSEMGRTLRERARDGGRRRLIHTEKRLSRGLCSPRLDDRALQRRLLQRVARLTERADGKGVVVAVDYTDIAKPFARPHRPRGMELACRCHDGSKKLRGMGYPVVQLEASLPDGNRCPVLYRPFSFAAAGFRSQNLEFLSAIEQASQYVGSRALWVMDRGFDGRAFFEGMDALGVRWACRLKVRAKNPRSLADASGAVSGARDMALDVVDRWSFDITRGRGRKRRVVRLTFGSKKVRVVKTLGKGPDPGGDRTLVVVWGISKDPLVLLAHEYRKGRAFALEILRAYMRRWRCEEATRGMKDRNGWGLALETIRALTFRGVCRLVMLAAAVYLFLAELRDAGWSGPQVGTFGPPPPDGTYRLIRQAGAALAAVSALTLHPWLSSKSRRHPYRSVWINDL